MLPDKNVLVLGAEGFLGKHVKRTCKSFFGYVGAPERMECDLENPRWVDKTFEKHCPNYVINCAGFNGGINFNIKHPYEIFSKNMMIATSVLNACVTHKVEKVISIITSCAYDSQKETLIPQDLMVGKPHETVEAHGYVKRNYSLLSKYAHQQFGLNALCVTLPTLFGPGDSFDIEKTKVMGALVKKFVDAKDNDDVEVVLWGDGSPRRQFCYVEDAATLMVNALMNKEYSDIPYHLGCEEDISIKELAEIIKSLVGYEGQIVFDTSKPNGQFRKELYQDQPSPSLTSLEYGINKTIEYYRKIKK
jgi:GDP-L-fucose synthase